jgi:Calcium binding
LWSSGAHPNLLKEQEGMAKMAQDPLQLERLETLLSECQNEWEQLTVLEASLEEQLDFPFRAVCDVPPEQGSFGLVAGDRVMVVGLLEADKQWGIMVRVRKGKRFFRCPLFRLLPKNLSALQKEAVNDYRAWFRTVGLPEIIELDE